jgi:hypothetical protein
MFTVSDEPDSKTQGKWRWGPLVTCERRYASIGWALCLLQYRFFNQPDLARYKFGESIIQGWFLEVHFKHPREWQIGSSHMYYDGPNCVWYCGPFSFYRTGCGCKKCYGGAH